MTIKELIEKKFKELSDQGMEEKIAYESLVAEYGLDEKHIKEILEGKSALSKEMKAEIENTVVETVGPLFKDFKDKVSTLNFAPAKADWRVEMGEKIRKTLTKELDSIVTGNKAITTTTMAAIIPEEWIKHIYETVPMYGAAFEAGLARIPLAEVVNMAKLGTDVTLEYQTENTAPSDSAPTVDAKPVNRETLIGTLVMSRQSLKYSAVELTNYFTQRFIKKYARHIDEEVFTGTASGSSKYTGITQASGTNSVIFAPGETSFNNINRDYLINAIHAINANHLVGAGWITNNQTVGTIHTRCVTSAGMPLFNYNTKQLLGYPVHITSALPATSAADTAFIIFGSVSEGVAFGEDGFEVASDASVKFAENAIMLRAVGDIAIYVIQPELFTIIKTSAT